MSSEHSTPGVASGKPAKPYSDFPLFPHAAGVWAKKIGGKMHYFGPWSDPDGALAKYPDQKDALHAGLEPRPAPTAATVKDAANGFLNHEQALLDAGELSPHTFANYKRAADTLVVHVGKSRLVADLDPQDFAGLRNKMSAKWGPHRLAVTIQHIRSVFKHAFDAGLIPTPVRFGPGVRGTDQENLSASPGGAGDEAVHRRRTAPHPRRRRGADEGDGLAGHQLRIREQ